MLSLGRTLLLLSSFATNFSFIADFDKTHIFNPRWPPHAKFHCGQTMSMAPVCFLACAYYALRSTASAAAAADSLFTAAVFGSVYYVSGMTAILYPGAAGTDPEFPTRLPQVLVFGSFWAVGLVGWWLEARALGGGA